MNWYILNLDNVSATYCFTVYWSGAGILQNQLEMACVLVVMQGKKEIAERILAVAEQRGADKSTCPSEIARMLFPGHWREQMAAVMEVAIDLCNNGKILITQKGKEVDVKKIKGPVRIKQVVG
ncbi:DUF3253 domain-containing protein [uncultured Pedobacter sp.]|uniref:DUF3253 domain-containing protein n=1 Tax=uncultured Pedobacter sp. TaxID=246139 RepID=UPI0025FECD71|nr:DUF3253 domain-containing protein [uncultured Pedobacter sp.]